MLIVIECTLQAVTDVCILCPNSLWCPSDVCCVFHHLECKQKQAEAYPGVTVMPLVCSRSVEMKSKSLHIPYSVVHSRMLLTSLSSTRPISTFAPLLLHVHSQCLKCVKILLVSFPVFLEEEEFPWEAFHIPGNLRAAGAAESRLFSSVHSLPLCSVVDQQPALWEGWQH